MQGIHYQKREMSQASVRWGLESNLVTVVMRTLKVSKAAGKLLHAMSIVADCEASLARRLYL